MPDHYDPNQPRDNQGCWSAEPCASNEGHVVKDIHRKAAAIIAGEKQVGKNSECVSLVKHLAPAVGPSSTWQEGPPIRGYGKPPLEPGTAIATFTGGRYPNAVTGNHAAIFLEYGMEDGRRGFWVLDQSKNIPPQKTFMKFGGRAEHYSVIKRK